MQGEADRAGHQGARPYVHRRPPGSRGRHQSRGRCHLVIIHEQRTHNVSGGEEPLDGEPPFDHEDRLIGARSGPASRVVEVPIDVESRVVGIVYLDERARHDDGRALGHVRHPH